MDGLLAMKPSHSVPPLRSTTLLRQPPSGDSSAGPSSIRLQTYHDTSDLKKALQKLQDAYAGDAETVKKPGGCADSAVNPRRAPEDPIVNVTTKKTSEPVRKKRGCALLKLSSQELLMCFSFCNLASLGTLCRVSVRMRVLVDRQGDHLWAIQARKRNVSIPLHCNPKEVLRNELLRRQKERRSEEDFYEKEVNRLEACMSARAAENYAQDIDVDGTLASCHITSTIPNSQKPTSQTKSSRNTVEIFQKLQAEVQALEAIKEDCLSKMKTNQQLIEQENLRWAEMEQHLAHLGCGNAAVSSELPPNTAADRDTVEAPLLTASKLDAFERRISRLVLEGRYTAAAIMRQSSTADDGNSCDVLPVVLRRGITDFTTLELALRTVTGRQTGDRPGGTAALTAAQKRWYAFQSFCPVNEEYCNIHFFLHALACSSSNADTVESLAKKERRPSPKQLPALLRLSALIRRVDSMTDTDVLNIMM